MKVVILGTASFEYTEEDAAEGSILRPDSVLALGGGGVNAFLSGDNGVLTSSCKKFISAPTMGFELLSCGEKKFLNEEETIFRLPNLEILERVGGGLINALCLICLLFRVLPSLISLSSEVRTVVTSSLREIISPQGRGLVVRVLGHSSEIVRRCA